MENKQDILGSMVAAIEEDMLKKDELESKLQQIVKENKDNKALKQYIRTLKQAEKLEDQTKEDKDVLYQEMVGRDIDYLEGALFNITLKRPYLRTSVDMKRFTEMFKKDSETYKTLIKETLCKGNVNVKSNL